MTRTRNALMRNLAAAALAGLACWSMGQTIATGQKSPQDALEQGFISPPDAAKPRVWWHWMNGNITKEGIKADLEWMKRAGIGEFQNFDASLFTPQVVEKAKFFRVVFKTMPPQGNPIAGLAGLPQGEQKPKGTDVAEIALHTAYRINRLEEKAGFTPSGELEKFVTPDTPNNVDAIPAGDIVDLTSRMKPMHDHFQLNQRLSFEERYTRRRPQPSRKLKGVPHCESKNWKL